MTTTVTLNDGTELPRIGLGTWQIPDADCEDLVAAALSAGYRCFDTAPTYHTERGVGAAVAASAVPRDSVVVSTKLWNADHGANIAPGAFAASLDRLGMDHVDLYLIHWPLPMGDRYVETWRALEKIRADGRIRTIGVSNFTIGQMRRLMDACDVVPAVNQVELHPLFQQAELREFHRANGIATQAWSPLGSGRGLVDLPAITRIAAEHGRSPAQVVLRWHLQLGNLVVPRSTRPRHLTQNLDVFGFELDERDMAAIAALDTGRRWGPDPDTFDYGRPTT